jgi:hypothetical protein
VKEQITMNDDDDYPYTVKQLPGVVMDSRKWSIVPSQKYLLEPKRFETQPGSPARCPTGVLEFEILLPAEYEGIAVSWYCNAVYDKETGEIVYAYNSKLAKTARKLFPMQATINDPPTGCLVEHYLIGEIVLADKQIVKGETVEKPKERQYSKVSELLAAGPRLQDEPSKRPTMDRLQLFFDECLKSKW